MSKFEKWQELKSQLAGDFKRLEQLGQSCIKELESQLQEITSFNPAHLVEQFKSIPTVDEISPKQKLVTRETTINDKQPKKIEAPKIKATKNKKVNVVVGQNFNNWTVIGRPEKDRPTHYLCRCKCGTERMVDKYTLGKTKGCGCEHKKWSQNKTKSTAYNGKAKVKPKVFLGVRTESDFEGYCKTPSERKAEIQAMRKAQEVTS